MAMSEELEGIALSVRRANLATHAFEETEGGEFDSAYKDDPQALLTDLLADLKHWADANGLDFYQHLEAAHMHYSAEVADERTTTKEKTMKSTQKVIFEKLDAFADKAGVTLTVSKNWENTGTWRVLTDEGVVRELAYDIQSDHCTLGGFKGSSFWFKDDWAMLLHTLEKFVNGS